MTDSSYVEYVREKINQKATRPGNLNASQRAEVVYIELLLCKL